MDPTKSPTSADIARAAEVIRAGGLVAFPTETVYGLGANALNPEAVRRIYTAKRRPSTSPLIVHVSSVEMAKSVVSTWPKEAVSLTDRFWPGPLTLILPKQTHVPDEVTAGLRTVGVRMPAHPVALQLIAAAGVPIAAPSANAFTKISPTEARHVLEGLGNVIDCILDGGPTKVGIESTVLLLSEDGNRLLRPGMIGSATIEAVIGPLLRDIHSTEGAHLAPGMHEKHYSPNTKVIVSAELPHGKMGYIWWKKYYPATRAIRMPEAPGEYARRLYAVLHELDKEQLDGIYIEPVPDTHEWEGIRDRLARASGIN